MKDRVVIASSDGDYDYFTYDPDPHRLDVWCHHNWMKIPLSKRKACLAHLKHVVDPQLLDMWTKQYLAGKRIGCNDIRFHFSCGMGVRNALRAILPDEELPPIKQEHAPRRWRFFKWSWGPRQTSRNWDDFYTGALEDLVEQEVIEDIRKRMVELAKDSKPA